MADLTGRHVRRLREALGLDQFAFAAVLGVHVSTVYRWETLPRVSVDPLQAEILKQLQLRLAQRRRLDDAGQAVVQGLIAGGMLLGLAALLKFLSDSKPRQRKRSATAGARRTPSRTTRRR
jgi:transcriptional regulator with XRE-family HTH domain